MENRGNEIQSHLHLQLDGYSTNRDNILNQVEVLTLLAPTSPVAPCQPRPGSPKPECAPAPAVVNVSTKEKHWSGLTDLIQAAKTARNAMSKDQRVKDASTVALPALGPQPPASSWMAEGERDVNGTRKA